MDRTTIYYFTIPWEDGIFYLAATNKGVCFVSSLKNGKEELFSWTKKNCPNALLKKSNIKIKPYTVELVEYLKGERNVFNLSVDLIGTNFQKKIWNALLSIPYGEVRSYTDIAKMIGKPNGVRAVASAIAKNPLLFVVPCHRVIHKNGDITGYRGGNSLKRRLHVLENII